MDDTTETKINTLWNEYLAAKRERKHYQGALEELTDLSPQGRSIIERARDQWQLKEDQLGAHFQALATASLEA